MAARSHLVVRRIEEETFSVVPSASVREGQATVGNPASGNPLCEVKVVRKFYEGDVPSTTDDHEALNKMIDQLVNRNTGKANTRPKELLGTTEHLDKLYCEASDNASPQMMSRHSNLLEGSSSFSRQEKREDQTNPLKKTAKMVAAAKKRVKEIVSKTPYSGKSDDEQQHLINEIEQLQKELAELKKEIESKQQDCPPTDSKNFVKSKFDPLQSTVKDDAPDNIINIGDSDDELMTNESDNYDVGISAPTLLSQEILKEIKNPETQDEIKNSMSTGEMMHFETLDDVKPVSRQVELVDGYGVYISLRQLDEANHRSANSPTRLLRNLLVVFFEPSVLATSTCRGNKTHPALNPDILGACFRYVQMKHPQVSRTVLVDCVNDKCANYRRKKHL